MILSDVATTARNNDNSAGKNKLDTGKAAKANPEDPRFRCLPQELTGLFYSADAFKKVRMISD